MNRVSRQQDAQEISLTAREIEILKLIMEGKKNREIAERLYFSQHTIKAILEKLYEKTGCRNRVQVVIFALKNNIIE